MPVKPFDHVWLVENLKKNARKKKIDRKNKIKNRFKVNKLFLFLFLNSFYLFYCEIK